MNLHQIKKPTEYVKYLQEHPHEIDTLFRELLISVTNFFRDPEAWEALRPYLEEMVTSRTENQMLRVWVPGCATGEEAYSLAIMLREAMDKVGRHLLVQIFDTDLDSEAIETARSGIYPDGIAGDVSPKKLDRYFVREDGSYRIRKELREMTVFRTAECDQAPAIHQAGFALVPKSAHLSECRPAEEAPAYLPLRAQARRSDVSGIVGDSGLVYGSVRAGRETLETVSPERKRLDAAGAAGDPGAAAGRRRGRAGAGPGTGR
jgi:hypothetical protein